MQIQGRATVRRREGKKHIRKRRREIIRDYGSDGLAHEFQSGRDAAASLSLVSASDAT